MPNLSPEDLAIFEKEYETEENPSTLLDEVNGKIPAGLESIPLVRFSSGIQRRGYSDERQMELVRQAVSAGKVRRLRRKTGRDGQTRHADLQGAGDEILLQGLR